MNKYLLKHRNPLIISMSLAGVFALLILLNATFLFDFIERESVDMRFILRGVDEPSGNVAIAFIGEESIKELGRWPWSRRVIAELIETLNDYGVRVIGFDVLFIDPEISPDDAKLKALSESFVARGLLTEAPAPQAYFKELKSARQAVDNDARMAATMAKGGNVVLGMAFLPGPKKNEAIPKFLEKAAYVTFSNQNEIRQFEPPQINDRALPVPILAEAAGNLGFLNSEPDPDGALRHEMMTINHDGLIYAPLGLRVAQIYLGLDNPELNLYFNDKITLGGREIPIDSQGLALVNYYGPSYTIPSYPIVDILNRKVPPEKLKGKAVIVGGAAVGMADLWPNPFTPSFLGVEKQATVVDNILQNNFLRQPRAVKTVNIAMVLFFGLLMGLTLPVLRTLWNIPFSLGCFVLFTALVQFVFVKYRVLLNFSLPALQILLAYAGISAYRYFAEERDKRFLQATFSTYLAPELIDEMYNKREIPRLGGEALNMTAYFTDIEGFSSFSEKLTAVQLVELLNEYLSEMTDILIQEKGCLDKYEGDAIVAFFGAPMHLPDHPVRACRTAVRMQRRLADLREKWRCEQLGPGEPECNVKRYGSDEWAPGDKWPRIVHEMRMRIGVNTGEIVVGNIGSRTRMNYTMMGDAVNLAARLEAAAKQYGVYVLVSEYTLNQEIEDDSGRRVKVLDLVEARLLDRIAVVGKTESVHVYELCGLKGELSERERRLFELFGEGLQLYFRMQWDEASQKFNQALEYEHFPERRTNPSAVFVDRCELFKVVPPVGLGEKWDGVFRLTKK
ncbi:MAG: adenylate/guanylate cyclase domain-containing protein [Thermodesulfobacteriota bacterium]